MGPGNTEMILRTVKGSSGGVYREHEVVFLNEQTGILRIVKTDDSSPLLSLGNYMVTGNSVRCQKKLDTGDKKIR